MKRPNDRPLSTLSSDADEQKKEVTTKLKSQSLTVKAKTALFFFL